MRETYDSELEFARHMAICPPNAPPFHTPAPFWDVRLRDGRCKTSLIHHCNIYKQVPESKGNYVSTEQ